MDKVDFSKMTKAERMAWHEARRKEREAKESPEEKARKLAALKELEGRPIISVEPDSDPELIRRMLKDPAAVLKEAGYPGTSR